MRPRHLLVLLAAACLPARAGEPLPDPTRPPAGVQAAAVPPGAAAAEAAPLQLQSVRLSAEGRYALINGQLLREGERLGEARLLRVEEGQATLQEGTSRIVLRLLPEARKDLAPTTNLRRHAAATPRKPAQP